MPIYRAALIFPVDTTLPRDRVMITPHFFGSDPQGLADALKTNLATHSGIGATKPFDIRIYDAQKPPPSFPLRSATQAGPPPVTDVPRELCLCLSYYSTWNRPRYRGRLYIPTPFVKAGGAIAQ